jgi:hypothetical protein
MFKRDRVGYSKQLDESKITNRYLRYTEKNFSVTVGHFYEQFGNGLVLRSYEERNLGFNNAIDGVNFKFTPFDGLNIKAFTGKHRKYFESSSGKLSGLDLDYSLSALEETLPIDIIFGFSWVNKYERNTSSIDISTKVDAYSFRSNIAYKGNSLNGEYVRKTEDPTRSNQFSEIKGEALLINASYSQKGLGFNAYLRRLENMEFRSERESIGEELTINYLPSLTRQHKYSLATLHPHAAQVNGEIGGQIDLFYKIKRKSLLGGKYGTKLHFNFSQYNDLKQGDYFNLGDNKFYSDVSFDIEKKWNKKLKTSFSFIQQDYNKGAVSGVEEDGSIKSTIIVSDILYKITPKTSLRTELQHLSTDDDQKNWCMVLAELNLAPKWSFYVSDMYNYGDTDLHYYSIGGRFSNKQSSFAFSYARNRAGIVCAGGVCREMPAYTGFNFTLTTRF